MSNLGATPVQIDACGALLEGRLALSAEEGRAAVITHPHPQYGGNMDNPVVVMIARTYQSRGWSTLRFNFRGTGNSQGAFDHGKGEQKDIDAAIACLIQAGASKIDLTGYSFGAWAVSLWAQNNTGHDHAIRLVAPPVAFMEYRAIKRIAGLETIIVGSRDEIAPPAVVARHMQTWRPRADLQIIENADHFFWDHMAELQAALLQSISA